MRKHVATSSAENFELRYFETVSQCERGEADFYGVCVGMYIDGSLMEETESGSISEDSEQVLEVIKKLSENSVTPVVLCEILDEMVSCL